MKIGGLQKTSLIDYPGKISSIVFTSGCNFRCPFCHNGDLVREILKLIPENEIFSHLLSRQDLLDGVVITGGEPTIQKDLPDFIRKIKNLGFSVKLDTNGSNPQMLENLISESLVDYVALDLKLPFDRYGEVGNDFGKVVTRTIQTLRQSSIKYEFRTTIVPKLISKDDLLALAGDLQREEKWYLQQFQPHGCLDREFEKIEPYKRAVLEEFLVEVQKYAPNVELRGL